MVDALLGKDGWGSWFGDSWPKRRGMPYWGVNGGWLEIGVVDGGGVDISKIGDRTEEGSGGGVEK
jgi:hypothetical protein